MAHSSPEPAASWYGGGELERCRASGLAPGKRQQASAFQGLRLAWSERRTCGSTSLPWGGRGWFGGGLEADVGEGGGEGVELGGEVWVGGFEGLEGGAEVVEGGGVVVGEFGGGGRLHGVDVAEEDGAVGIGEALGVVDGGAEFFEQVGDHGAWERVCGWGQARAETQRPQRAG